MLGDKHLLVLMAKQPLVGQTKTRLVPAVSLEIAAELYHCFLVDKVAAMRTIVGVDCGVAYSPVAGASFFAELVPDFSRLAQVGGNLGERLTNVFAWGFAQGYQAVVAIDGDSVTLPADYLQQAFTALANAEVSLGPCEDGGYYAIGMKSLHPTLFDVEMSTPSVLRDTLHQAELANLKVQLLPQWYDIDTPTDLVRLRAVLHQQDTATARYLRGGLA